MPDEIRIGIRTDDADLDKSAKKIEGLGTSTQTMAKEAGGGLSGLLGSVSQLGFGIFGLQQTFGGLKSAIGGLFSSNVQFEQFQVQFEVLLGSADKAKTRMNELAVFAKDTPFELPQVVTASKILETFGGSALSTGKGLTLLGDVASGTGVPIEELATHWGRLYDGLKNGRPVGEAMQRLQEVGAISGETRNRIEEMQKAGVDGEVVWSSLTESMGKYSGMMAKQSQTAGGAISNIQDGLNMLKRNLMQGIFEAAKPGLMAFATWLGSEGVQGRIQDLGEAIGTFMGGGVQLLTDGIGNLVGLLSGPAATGLGYLSKGFDLAKDAVTAALGPVERLATGAFGKMLDIIPKIIPAIVDFGREHRLLFSILTPIGSLALLIYDHFDKLREVFTDLASGAASKAVGMFGDIKEKVEGLYQSITGPMDWKSGFLGQGVPSVVVDSLSSTIDKLQELWDVFDGLDMKDVSAAWGELGSALGDLWVQVEPVANIFKDLAIDIGGELMDAVNPLVSVVVEELVPAFKDLWDAIQPLEPLLKPLAIFAGAMAVGPLLLLLEAIKFLIPVFAEGMVLAIRFTALEIKGLAALIELSIPLVKKISEVIVDVAIKSFDLFKDAIDGVKKAIDLTKPIWPVISDGIKIAVDIGVLAFDTLKLGVETWWKFTKAIVETAFGILQGLFQIGMGILHNNWGEVWDGMLKVLSSIWDGIKKVVGVGLDALKKAVKDIVPDMLTLGGDLIQGLADGVEASVSLLVAGVFAMWDLTLKGLGKISDWLIGAGEDLIKGFIQGIRNKFDDVKGTLGELTSKLTDWKGPPEKDATLLEPTGELIIGGLITGFRSQFDDVQQSLSELTLLILSATVAGGGEVTKKLDGVAGDWVTVLEAGLNSGASLSKTAIGTMFDDLQTLIQDSGLDSESKLAIQGMAYQLLEGFKTTGSLSNTAMEDLFKKLVETAKKGGTELATAVKSATGAGGSGGYTGPLPGGFTGGATANPPAGGYGSSIIPLGMNPNDPKPGDPMGRTWREWADGQAYGGTGRGGRTDTGTGNGIKPTTYGDADANNPGYSGGPLGDITVNVENLYANTPEQGQEAVASIAFSLATKGF